VIKNIKESKFLKSLRERVSEVKSYMVKFLKLEPLPGGRQAWILRSLNPNPSKDFSWKKPLRN